MSFQINFGGVGEVGQALADAQGKIVEELARMEAVVEGRLAEWSGDARDSYVIRKKEWDDAAAQMGSMLGLGSKTLHRANEGYVDTERRNVNLWSR